MKLGLNVAYWGLGITPEQQLDMVRDAESAGFDSVWAAEAYGSDAATVLAWLAAQTERIKLGSAIFQMPARSPAMTAMTAATLDELSGGRMILGIGPSGPQVAEGWHGQPFARQLQRTREYVEILRKALARERLEYDGEISDGWIPFLFSAEHAKELRGPLEEGAARAGRDLDDGSFDIAPTVNVCIGDDLDAARDVMRPFLALYVGGMGSREKNFYNAMMRRYGFEEAADEVQDLYLSGQKNDAAAALPAEFIDSVCLVGPADRVAERLAMYRDAGVGTLLATIVAPDVAGRRAMIRQLAELN